MAAFFAAPQVFLGTTQPSYPGPILALIALTRYVILSAYSCRFSSADMGAGRMHIYVYGSVCRGEFVPGSDVDLLAVLDDSSKTVDLGLSIPYMRLRRLEDLWAQGNPFAWHLAIESKLIYAEDDFDVIGGLDQPAPYANWQADSKKFYELFVEAAAVLAKRRDTTVFELSTIFLAMRNFAICFSLMLGTRQYFRDARTRNSEKPA